MCLKDCAGRDGKKLELSPCSGSRVGSSSQLGTGKILNVSLTGGMEREQVMGEAEVARDPRTLA